MQTRTLVVQFVGAILRTIVYYTSITSVVEEEEEASMKFAIDYLTLLLCVLIVTILFMPVEAVGSLLRKCFSRRKKKTDNWIIRFSRKSGGETCCQRKSQSTCPHGLKQQGRSQDLVGSQKAKEETNVSDE